LQRMKIVETSTGNQESSCATIEQEMEERPIQYRRVNLGLRAPRLAVLIGSDCHWGHCLHLVETLTETWGGATFAVIPTDGQSISPVFWKLLKLHDPDWITVFDGTAHVSDGLQQELRRRHSVALPWGQHLWPLSPDNIGYPLTGVHDALPESETLPKVTDLSVDADGLVQLMIQATTGALSEATKKKLHDRGLDTVGRALAFDDDVSGLYDVTSDIWEPAARSHHIFYPFNLSSLNLGLYFRPPGLAHEHALVVVCGNSIEDFAYFWTLRTLRGLPLFSDVYWVPLFEHSAVEAHRHYKKLWPWLGNAIAQSLDRVWRDKRVLITSVSLEPERLGRAGQALYAANPIHIGAGSWGDEAPQEDEPRSLPTAVVAPDKFEELLPYSASCWETENTPDANASIVHFFDGEGKAVLQTPMPSSVAFKYESEMRWIVEAMVEGLRVPTRPALRELVVRPEGFANYRVSRDGVAFTAVSDFKSSGMATRSLLVRPTLRLPTAWQVVEALCEAEDLAVSASDKGQYERETLRLFGDLESVASEIRDPRIAATLFKFLDESPNEKGVTDEGVKISGREGRVLDMRALRKLWGGDDKAAQDFANRCLERGVVQLGLLIIKCPYCRRADWYRLADVSDSVTCHRCSRGYVFPADTSIYFKLDEIVALALKQGSRVPLLVLDLLRRRSAVSFLHTTACDVFRPKRKEKKPWLEVDFFAISDGAFIIGECKRDDQLRTEDKAQLKKYVELCRALLPDRLLVATGAPEWDQAANAYLDQLEDELQRLGVSLWRLTGRDVSLPPVA